ncbi:MAG: sigma 54-interacting transcriptional regulator, partial [Myxococcales bacterium]|nr:sigma 54-interacting transcriptional regulator [Myxococcales bacterium]
MDPRYETQQSLSKGDIAEAWLAIDRLSGAEVVLKQVRRADHVDVLRREFEALRGLAHPNLVEVLDFVFSPQSERLPCLVTRFVPGVSLVEFARSAPLSESLAVVADAVAALHQLHSAGIRHGDFKPGNILVTPEGRGVLIDLSCTSLLGETLSEVSGTPGYLAPEFARGRADHRADFYAVGISLRDLAELRGEALPEEMRKLAERLTRSDPRTRPGDAAELLEALGRQSLAPHPLLVPKTLLGRERELSFLEHWLEQLVSGGAKTRNLVLSGPPGSGRSRLLREFKWIAGQRVQVLDTSGSRPGAVFELLGIASRRPPPHTLAEVLGRVESLSNADAPLLLLMDDASRLAPSDRQAWLALCRSLEPTAALGVVSVENSPINKVDHEPSFEELTLGALPSRAVFSWLKDQLPRSRVERAIQLTAGLPAQLETLVSLLASGALTEDDLARGDLDLLGSQAEDRFRGLSPEQLRTLALASLAPEDAGNLDPRALSELVRAGLLTRRGSNYEPLHGFAALALKHCPTEIQKAIHREIAGHNLERVDSAGQGAVAAAAKHLAEAGDLGRAAELVSQHEQDVVRNPSEWLPAAQVLVGSSPSALREVGASSLLRVEQLLRSAGRPREALAMTARLLRIRPDARPELRLRAAAAFLQLGNVKRCERYLRLIDAHKELRPQALEILTRARVRAGQHQEAERLAREALEALGKNGDPLLVASLESTLGVALSYLGETTAADDMLKRAATAFARSARPKDQLRAISYRALNAYRAGRTAQAATEYRQVLEVAEQHGLGENIANAALNYGVACHQAGELGAALDSYQRGLRLGIALGQVSVTVALTFNLAKLYTDVGATDRASLHVKQLEARAKQQRLEFWVIAAATLRGELALARSEFDAARQAFGEALTGFSQAATRREQAEVELHLAETELAAWSGGLGEAPLGASEVHPAEAHIAKARDLLQPLDAPDVLAKLHLSEAKLSLAQSDARAATTRIEQVLPTIREAGQLAMLAEAESLLAQAWEAAGASTLAQRARESARESWERVAASLPRGLRSTFWGHGSRSRIAPQTRHASVEGRASKLERLLAVNRKLNSSVTTQEVLAVAIDSAIELTGAERGFVLLAEGATAGGEAKKFSVVVARNVDRERIGRSHLKFSRSIAEQAVKSGEPVLTVDASSDPRFVSNQSVHAMQLKSVVCVPIRSPERTLGALYLDNRFRPANFDEADMGLLLAFADQVAIALRNAQLHDELRLQADALLKRTQELEAERARVAELAEGQAREIDRLTDEVKSRQAALESRYDYGQIVGKSPAMERLFAKLDRVIDTNASVIIEGESGTGKELVARAVHFNSPRKQAPFVAINCSAVPASLLESELFGHVRGAFTGADRDREGLLAAAKGGTVFLDEIGETPLEMQAKLLRALEDHEVRPVGAQHSVKVDFRLVCATNRHLRDEVAAGRFREDLFYRISVVEIQLPALRDREGDVLLVAERLLERICGDIDREPPALGKDAVKALLGYSWPGNVRELENVLTNAVLLGAGDQLRAADLHLPGGKKSERKAK